MRPLEPSDPCVAGVDGGGSHTQCLILDRSARVVGRGSGGPSNHQSVGVQSAQAALAEALNQARQAAGRPALAAACFGMAGLDREEDFRILRTVAEAVLPDLPVDIVHDTRIALVGGTQGGLSGVAIIAGTGSSVVAYAADGRIARSGGWGHLLWDEGSGYDICRRALNAATRAADGRGPGTALLQRLPAAVGLPSLEALADRIYLDGWSAPQIASLAPAVIEAAQAGDAVAAEILDGAADELALAATAVIRSLGMQTEAFEVVLSGGIFQGCAPISQRVRQGIVAQASLADVHLPRREPVWGAAWLALQTLDPGSFPRA